LKGLFARIWIVFPEIHTEVSQIFNDDNIVFLRKFAYNCKLFLCETDPWRIIRIRKSKEDIFPWFQMWLKFFLKFLSPVIININMNSNRVQAFLPVVSEQENQVDKQSSLFGFVISVCYQKLTIAPIIEPTVGIQPSGSNINIKEEFNKSLKFPFQGFNTWYVRVNRWQHLV